MGVPSGKYSVGLSFFVMHSLPPLRSAPSENEHRISALIVIVGYLISTKVVS